MARRSARIGAGLVLSLLGVKNIVFPYPYPPVGPIEDVTYYGVSSVLTVVGLYLIFRRSRKNESNVDAP